METIPKELQVCKTLRHFQLGGFSMPSSEVLDAGGERSQVREGKRPCFSIVPPTVERGKSQERIS